MTTAGAGGDGNGTGQPHDRIAPSHSANAGIDSADGAVADVEISLRQKMLSAVSGSVLTSLLVTPLDVVRVRLQSQSIHSPPSNTIRPNPDFPYPRSFSNLPPNLGVTACCKEVFWVNNNAPYCVAELNVAPIGPSGAEAAAECAIEESQRKTFNSTFDGLRKIARNEGFTTLWRGLSPTLVMAVPGNVIYFAGYDWLRASKNSPMHGRIPDVYTPLVAGSTARMLAALFVSPIELFRTRMQASHSSSAAGNFRDTLNGVREMVQSQGPLTLWRGLTLTLWRDVPFSALYWWGYEATRNALIDARDGGNARVGESITSGSRSREASRSQLDHASTLIDSFAAGAISGGLASIVTTPFDVGKTRQQVYRHSGDSRISAVAEEVGRSLGPEDRSMPKLLWHIFKNEGMPGLFRGWAARTLKVAPACAIMISSYELGKKMSQTAKQGNA